jgi:hypothetical protein
MLQPVSFSTDRVKRGRRQPGFRQYVFQCKTLMSTNSKYQSSLKKVMTMLGRVRRRQEDENPEIRISRPAKNSRTEDFYKAVMVQSQRLRLE